MSRPVVLVLLLAGAVACRSQQTPVPAAGESPRASPSSSMTQSLVTVLPATGTPPGWTRKSEPQVFGQGNLWEYIDGAAETYLQFGFQEAATAAYAHAGGLEATVDVYRMTDALGAFGIYAQERNPNAEPIPVGVEGYAGSNVVNFWAGPCYVKITAPAAGEGVAAALRALAGAVAGRLPAGRGVPPEIGAFPQRNLVSGSIRYVPRDLVGQSYLANALEAQYQDGKAPSKLAVARFDSASQAAAALDQYRAFLARTAPVRALATSPGDAGFAGEDRFYGHVIAVRSGTMLALSLGAPADEVALGRVADLLASLARAAAR